jgi:tetratricopeptide (TPR) repeat protein
MIKAWPAGWPARACALLALLAAPGLALAQPASPAPAAEPQRVEPRDPNEQADLATVAAAGKALVASGPSAITAFVPDLQRVLSHMPSPYSKSETHGSVIEYHADNVGDFLIFSAAAQKAGAAEIVWTPQPYAEAGFLLGYYYDDIGDTADAIAALNAGLVAEPANAALLGERGAAFNGAKRFEEGLASYDAALATADLPDKTRARLLRGRGFALTELKRYDEAEQAYQTSLGLDPGNALALNELKYIAGLKAGAAPTPGSIIKAKPPGQP